MIIIAVVVIGIGIYVVKFKNSQGDNLGNFLDKLMPKRVEKRKDEQEKEDAWAKTLIGMTPQELNNLRAKLKKRNSDLMKSGRDMKTIEAQQELIMKQRIVEEKLRTTKQ